MDRLFILGGTTEGRLLAQFCAERGLEAFVSVATEYGESLTNSGGTVKVVCGRMDGRQMEEFIEKNGISRVIDATHPYAREVTAQAKAAARAAKVPYIRCVRESVSSGGGPGIVSVESAEEAVSYLSDKSGAVLLLTGSKTVEAYTRLPGYEERLYVRLLPEESQVRRCRELGIKGAHLICMQGPFSAEMNAAVIRHTGARYIVTKESGAAGGFSEKIEAARLCGVTAVVIGRGEREEGLSLKEVKSLLSPGRPGVYLIGIGMGDAGGLTVKAAQAIRGCGLLAGARRMVDSAGELAKAARRVYGYLPEEILKAVEEYEGDAPAAVLFSGDTGFYSGAGRAAVLLKKKGYEVTVFPGISSMAYLAARIGISWEDAAVVSLHGREADPAGPLMEGRKKVFYLLDGKHRAKEVLSILCDRGFGGLSAAVGERLSAREEAVTEGTAEALAGGEYDPLSVLFVYERRERP